MEASRRADCRIELGLVLAAAVVALVGARPFAGGWNDGSRLAAAESLGERGTLVIDESLFVRVPPPEEGRPEPYSPPQPFGTLDKLLIDGHFYSDKPPVQAVLMGSFHRVWLLLGGPPAADRPELFCRFQTLVTSGLVYVLAVWCVVRLGRRLGLSGRTLLVYGGSSAFCTFAPTYSRYVNGHISLLGVTAALCLVLAKPDLGRGRAAVAGLLAGFGYTLDLGLGPGLLLATGCYCVAVGGRRTALPFVLGAAPWLGLHHALNYAIGGTLAPANTVPEYLAWPGSPFTGAAMTGGWKHGPFGLLVYGADLFVGKKGFLTHNLPLWLAPGGAVLLWLRRPELRPAVGFAVGVVLLGWFPYAATSHNWSGVCCSVRWFVPFLAPGFWVVGLVLREYPRYRPDFALLSGVGAVLGGLMWWAGPWEGSMPLGLWGWVGLAAVGWGIVRWRTARTSRAGADDPQLSEPRDEVRKAA